MSKDYGIKAFQEIALTTAVFQEPDYPLLALGEEAGEVLGKVAKHGRKNGLSAADVVHQVAIGQLPELRADLVKELGDVIWQWSLLCKVLNIDPAVVMEVNNMKLAGRAARGTINGEGDDR